MLLLELFGAFSDFAIDRDRPIDGTDRWDPSPSIPSMGLIDGPHRSDPAMDLNGSHTNCNIRLGTGSSRLVCISIVNLPLRGRLWDTILAPQGSLGGALCVCGVLWYQNVGKGSRKVASTQNLGGPKGPLDR